MKLKKLLSGISALAVAASAFAGLAVTADAASYANQAVDLSKFDDQGTYNSTTGVETLSLGGSKWTKLDLTPYTQKGSEHVKTITISYKETVPSGGRTAIGIYDMDKATYATKAWQDTTGSYVCYGVMGSGTDKRVYLNGAGAKANGGFAVDAEEEVSLTFDMDAKKFSGKIGAHNVGETAFGELDSVDVFAVYSWNACTYTISDMHITVETTDETYYTVTYDIKDTTSTESVKANSSVASVPDTDVPGYTFKGWTKDSSTTLYTTEQIQAMAITADTTFTAQYDVDTSYVEAISSVSITGADKMTFGPDPDTAASNPYTVVINGADGTTITESNLSSNVKDFNVAWDIDGFKTANDTAGQYCDSYGAFETNNAAKVATSFELRNVPMNFYGKMTATVTYNGGTYTATKYVAALGNTAVANGQILPEAGYPSDFDVYPDSLTGYQTINDTYGTKFDTIVGGWVMSGSDGNGTAVLTEENNNKFMRVTAGTTKKSHVFTNSISAPSTQVIFEQDVRFNATNGVITLTSKYPFYGNGYTNAVTLAYDGTNLKLNGTAVTKDDASVTISKSTWYHIVLSIDKTTETCYAVVKNNGTEIGSAENVAWNENSSSPTFYSIGIGNDYTGTIDFDNYSAYYPTADTSTYTLTASQDTLSIPNGDTADLAASLKTADGYDITGAATWTVLEDDMKEGVIITPDESDSHKAKVTLASTAEAGEATVQVNIGGYTKTITLNITSSAESVKFTKSNTSVSIPLNDTPITAEYAAAVVDGSGNEVSGRTVTFAVYDKNNTSTYTLPAGISFANGVLTVTKAAPAVTFTIRATGKNSNGEDISKSVKVTVHGLSFDFGAGDDAALAEGYTAVSADTSYTEARGYGISSGSVTAGGTASTEDATADYLEGAMTFKADVQKGKNYTVEITYQGTLKTGKVNNDLAGYELGTQTALATASYIVPVPVDTLDLEVSGDSAKIAAITITKNSDKTANAKPDIHHVGDSTAANNGSWAYYIDHNRSSFPVLTELATFYNNGAGGRNLSTYYTEGKLASVLRSIEPGDIVMFGNNGTNGMGSSFEADVNYYLDAAEAMGAKIITNSYTPHGAVSSYASGYNSSTHTFNSYRQDSYDVILRKVAGERAASDPNYLGFVEIGKNADAAFNAYVADYAANGYASADAAAQAIIACFSDHNHYSNGSIARDLMLNGYGDVKGIVAQLVEILNAAAPKTFDDIIKEDTEGDTVTITDPINGNEFSEPARATVANGVTVDVNAEIRNATITSNGTFTVKKDESTITNVSTVQFDDNGKINPGDGAIISTPNKEDTSKTDNGYFITKSTSGDKVKIKVDNKTVDVEIGETIQGDVLFCVFVTGIPEGKTVQVSAD